MALRFNGITGNRCKASGVTLAPVDGYTISCVGKVTVDANAYATFFTLGTADANTINVLAQTDIDGQTLVWYDYTGLLLATGPVMTLGAYYGIVLSGSGTSTTASITMRVMRLDDGTVAPTTYTKTGYGNSTYTGNWQHVQVGDTHFTPEALNGTVENLQIFDRVLTADECVQTWKRRVPVARPTRWWPLMADTLANTLTEASGQGADLVQTGTTPPTIESGAPIPWGAQPIIVPATATTHEQEGFRFYNDDGSESAATALAAQDTNASLAPDTPKRLRMLINAAGDPPSTAYRLQYRKTGDPKWTDVV